MTKEKMVVEKVMAKMVVVNKVANSSLSILGNSPPPRFSAEPEQDPENGPRWGHWSQERPLPGYETHFFHPGPEEGKWKPITKPKRDIRPIFNSL